jgi:hypothetical protein
VYLLVVFTCHDIMVVLPVKCLVQMLLDLYHLLYGLPYLFNNLDFAYNLGILWLWNKGNLLRLLLNVLIKELLVEGVVLVVVLTIGD